jgi:hypothetical protein
MRPTDCDRPRVALLLGVVSLTSGAQQPRITLCEGGAGCDEADAVLQADPAGEPELGFSLAMGYLNGDLFSDLVVGAPGVGKVYVLFGSLDAPVTASPPVISDLDNNADLVLCDGPCDADPPNTATQFGFSVSIGPRVNGSDQVGAPLLIGAPAVNDPNSRGAAYIIESAFAPASSQVDVQAELLAGTTGVIEIVRTTAISPTDPADQIGYAVAVGPLLLPSLCNNMDSCTSDLECVGICNHVDDFVVSARMAAAGGTDRGMVYVIPRSAVVGNTIDLDTAAGITEIVSTADNEGLGESLAVANLDKDADPDAADPYELAIGAVGTAPDDTDNFEGRVYYVLVAGVMSPIMLDATIPSHVTFEGDRPNDFFGFSLAAGDFDAADDDVDLAIGAIYGPGRLV